MTELGYFFDINCLSLTTIKTKLINGIANILSALTLLTNTLNNKLRHLIVFISISEFSVIRNVNSVKKNWSKLLICCHGDWLDALLCPKIVDGEFWIFFTLLMSHRTFHTVRDDCTRNFFSLTSRNEKWDFFSLVEDD